MFNIKIISFIKSTLRGAFLMELKKAGELMATVKSLVAMTNGATQALSQVNQILNETAWQIDRLQVKAVTALDVITRKLAAALAALPVFRRPEVFAIIRGRRFMRLEAGQW